jgi:hypothetical protein
MSEQRERVIARIDGYTRFCLTAIVVLLTVMIVGLWAQTATPSPASAAEPFDPKSTRNNEIVSAQEKTTAKIDELIALLKSGEARIQVTAEGEKGGSNASSKSK